MLATQFSPKDYGQLSRHSSGNGWVQPKDKEGVTCDPKTGKLAQFPVVAQIQQTVSSWNDFGGCQIAAVRIIAEESPQRSICGEPANKGISTRCDRSGRSRWSRDWRRGWDSNPRMEVLQTSPLGLLGTAPLLVSIAESAKTFRAWVPHDLWESCPRLTPGSAQTHNNLDSRGDRVCFAQKARGFFRRRWIDVEARAPLEAGDLRELGNNLNVPVIVVVGLFTDRRGMDHQIISGTVQNRVETQQRILHHPRQRRIDGALIVLEGRAVDLRQNPHLKRKPRRIRGEGDEMLVVADYPYAGVLLLADDVAEDAAFFLVVVVPAAFHLLVDQLRHDGQGNELRVRMLQRGASRFAVILEDQDVAEALVVLQVEHAVAIRPEDILHGPLGKRGERSGVIRRLDDHLVRPDSVHLVEGPFAFSVQVSFNSQRGIFVRHNADGPPRGIGAAAVASINQNLRRSLGFAAVTKRASSLPFRHDAFPQEFHRPLSTVRGNDDPAAGDGVSSKLGQPGPPRACAPRWLGGRARTSRF